MVPNLNEVQPVKFVCVCLLQVSRRSWSLTCLNVSSSALAGQSSGIHIPRHKYSFEEGQRKGLLEFAMKKTLCITN